MVTDQKLIDLIEILKKAYCHNDNTLQVDLKIQGNLYQNHSWLLGKNQQDETKIHIELQGTQTSPNNL